jgi:hypothetical protein
MIAGQVIGQGVATTAAGVRVPFVMVRVEPTTANMTELARESRRWQTTALEYRQMASSGRLSGEVAHRASFADEVLAAVGINTLRKICCNLVAQATDGRILGAAHYRYQSTTEGYIDLVAVAPEHLPGAPTTGQLRGVGTAMVAAIGHEYVGRGVRVIYLNPLDQEAFRFWTGRGFHVCAPPGWRLCVRDAEIGQLIGSCQLQPDCGDTGDCVVCGRLEDTASLRVPVLRGV